MAFQRHGALHQHLPFFAIWAFGFGAVAVACGGSENQVESGQSGDPGDNTDLESNDCSGRSWSSPEDTPRDATCERSEQGEDWLCSCGDGTEASSEAEKCRDALREECEIDLLHLDHCTSPTYGTCWPDEAEGEFHCLCDSGSEDEDFRSGTGESCFQALQDTCVEQCADDTGHCSATFEGASSGEYGAYSCECADDPEGPDWGELEGTGSLYPSGSCESVLAHHCGSSCEGDAGTCTATADGYECSCADGLTGSVSGEHSLEWCEFAINDLCGAFEPAPSCSSKNGTFEGTCQGESFLLRAGDAPPTTWSFDCECVEGPGSSSSNHDASSCDEALQLACPDAIRPPGGNSPLALRDYGKLCEVDDDCEDGACYVPGTQQDPICSKSCASNADCPDGSTCFWEHCFIACEPDDDEGCLTLNEAVDNPLFCLDLENAGEGPGNICIQGSEP